MKEKDVTEKLLEEYNDVFADIMNVLLFDGDDVVKESALEPAGDVSMYKVSEQIHSQERDVSKYWVDEDNANSRIILALIGGENQTIVDRDMPFRTIGYDGAAYRDQLNREEGRYPVVTMVLYFGTEQHWNKQYRSLYGVLNISERLQPYVNDYQVHVFEIAWLDDATVAKFKSDFKIVADYFVQVRKNKNYVATTEQIHHVQEILNLMSALTCDNRFREAQGQSKKGEATMSEVLDRVENRGIARGIAQEQHRIIINMHNSGFSDDQIVTVTGRNLADVQAVIASEQPVMA